jgi:hypothetical protein
MANRPPSFSMLHDSNPYEIEFSRGGRTTPRSDQLDGNIWWTVIVNGEIFASAKRQKQNEWLCMRGSAGRYFGRTAEDAVIQCVKGEIKKK